MTPERWLGLGLLVAGAALLTFSASFATRSAGDERAQYRVSAYAAQEFTRLNLLYLGGAEDCPSAPYLTYRRDLTNTTFADHWYVALQVRADAAMLALGDEPSRCLVEKAYPWMEMLWSPAHAGYAPRADLDGSNPTLQDVYADDNAVIGLAFLDIARSTKDPALRARALASADRAARYPLVAGLWDGEFGGGLWWTNQKDGLGEGKPAQSTALLAQVMAELYAETGNPEYRQIAEDALGWLDRVLWNQHHQLYAYGVVHPPDDPQGVRVTQRYFGYDQAIAIQALLTLYRMDTSRTEYLTRAQQLGRATDKAFWHPELGGYTLEAGIVDLYAAYGVWVSEGLLDLYAADGDTFWLERARANFDTLDERFQAGNSGGYYRMTFPCARAPQLCQPDEVWGYDRNVYGLSQAMMQRVAALLAATK